jgi:hypothetical protein
MRTKTRGFAWRYGAPQEGFVMKALRIRIQYAGRWVGTHYVIGCTKCPMVAAIYHRDVYVPVPFVCSKCAPVMRRAS